MSRIAGAGIRSSANTGIASCASLAITLAAVTTGALAAEPKRGDAQRDTLGRLIYQEGRSPSGARIVARIGTADQAIEGAAVACGNCHGPDGRGRAEGGIAPPNIRWSELTKPYGHRHEQGRVHGPFDERAFERAVKHGVDPSGQRMDAAMPRYAMSAKDLVALRAWLERLDTLVDPGVSEKTLRIGTLLPGHGPSAAIGELLRTLFQRHFDAINERGIHGRRLELVVHALPADAAEALDSMQQWLERADVFALLAPLSAGIEEPLSRLAAARKLPVIGPLTLYPEDAGASNLMIFHLLPGVIEQARVLAAHAASELGVASTSSSSIAIWHGAGERGAAQARALQLRLRAQGWRDVMLLPVEAQPQRLDEQATRLRKNGVRALALISHGGDLPAMAAALERAAWSPQLLVPAALAGRGVLALAPMWRDKLLLAYPTPPGHERDAALTSIARMLPDAQAAQGHGAILLAAHSAALLLAETLKRSGRDVSRQGIVDTLEATQGFETGVTPQLSFNADRRIGAQGAWLARLAPDGNGLRPLAGYRTP